MANLDNLLFDKGNEIGLGGAVALTGAATGKATLRQVMQDIAADMVDLDTAGAYGLTLEFTADAIPPDFGAAGAYVIPAGGIEPAQFREMLKAIATDLAAFAVAQGESPSVHLHLSTRIPQDFLAGGSSLVPLRGDELSDQIVADVKWKWIGSPLYAIAVDLAAINARDGGLGVTLRTTVTPI